MSQNYTYPPGFSTSSNPSIGVNGAPAPTSSTEVGGINPSNNLEALKVDASGNLLVNTASSVLPTGAATAANQVTQISQFPATLGQKTSAGSTSVVLASDQSAVPVSQSGTWNINNVSGTVSLPTGASTSALQTQISAQLPTTLGAHLTAASLAVNIASDQTVPVSGSVTVSGTVAATQSGTWNLNNISGTVSLPTGAATSANQTTANSSLSTIATNTTGLNTTITTTGSAVPADALQIGVKSGSNLIPLTLGQTTMSASVPVTIASNQSAIPVSGSLSPTTGRSIANAPVYNVYSTTNITTSAYVQLVASTTSTTNYLDIFDSSGQAMIIGVGGSGSEVIQGYVPPGGDQIPLSIPAGSRVSYKALTANATSGYLTMSFYT